MIELLLQTVAVDSDPCKRFCAWSYVTSRGLFYSELRRLGWRRNDGIRIDAGRQSYFHQWVLERMVTTSIRIFNPCQGSKSWVNLTTLLSA